MTLHVDRHRQLQRAGGSRRVPRVARAAPPPSDAHEIIVVDNASTGRQRRAARSWPGVRIDRARRERRLRRRQQRGIRATRGELLLLLNSDTIVPPARSIALVDRLLAHAGAAAAGPRLVDGDGRAELSFGPMISPLGELRQKIVGRSTAPRIGRSRRWIAGARRARRGLGQRRVPARARADAEAAGPARRAVLHVHRGRRLLRRAARARAAGSCSRPGRRGHASARPIARRAPPGDERPTAAATSRSTRSTTPLGARAAARLWARSRRCGSRKTR